MQRLPRVFNIVILVFFSISSLTALTVPNESNFRPVVGILSQPSDPPIAGFGKQYIAASYVKFLEAAGARVLPIRYDITFSEAYDIFNSINGLLFTGGAADLNGTVFFNTASFLLHLALQANEDGNYFPVWGTCQGFEIINVVISRDMSILKPFDAENISLALEFNDLAKQSRLFKYASPEILRSFETMEITMNNHRFGIEPSSFKDNEFLAKMFEVLSVNKDRAGKPFVSSVEGRELPIYAVQWHPEKNQFEWDPEEGINHSSAAIAAMQYVSDFFVTEARRNRHALAPKYERDLMTNHVPVFTYNALRFFQQCYFL